jgi:NTP pyrophosphatase (non-canonical NTP hydrolase)
MKPHLDKPPHAYPEAYVVQKLRDGMLKEIGDVLWYLDALAHTVDSSLAECAQLNVSKLTGRAQRGTSLGSGDDR